MQVKRFLGFTAAVAFAPFLALPAAGEAATPVVANPLCPVETAFYAPDTGGDIVVPPGFTVSVFAKNLGFSQACAWEKRLARGGEQPMIKGAIGYDAGHETG